MTRMILDEISLFVLTYMMLKSNMFTLNQLRVMNKQETFMRYILVRATKVLSSDSTVYTNTVGLTI